MTVQALWFDERAYQVSGLGYEPRGELRREDGGDQTAAELENLDIMLKVATMASSAEIHEPDEEHHFWYPIGDPTEAALVTLAAKLAGRSPRENEDFPQLQEFPFDGEPMRMSSVRRFPDGLRLAVKGSSASLLQICTRFYRRGEAVSLGEAERRRITELTEVYSRRGMRVLAFARLELDSAQTEYQREAVERELTFLGLMAMLDPPKEGVREAVRDAREAHIRVFILTGDHRETARAVGRAIGLQSSGESVPVVTGREFKEMDEMFVAELLSAHPAVIFARVDPEDKLRIVELLEDQGEIVAVTGEMESMTRRPCARPILGSRWVAEAMMWPRRRLPWCCWMIIFPPWCMLFVAVVAFTIICVKRCWLR